jgi:ABC-type sulfate/molybdate transport systems ATPase subunit
MSEPWLEVDLRVRAGTAPLRLRAVAPCVAVSGPSGAGKSTLLRALAGLERAATGALTVRGERWLSPDGAAVPPWRRRVGWVPQEPLLFPHLSVRENLGYAGRGVDPEVVEWLGVGGLLERAPRHLSGGERQRVALGRALGAAPDVLLLDEPFSALDPALRGVVREGLARWCRARDARVVLVSHQADDAAAFDAERWTCVSGALSPAAAAGPDRTADWPGPPGRSASATAG